MRLLIEIVGYIGAIILNISAYIPLTKHIVYSEPVNLPFYYLVILWLGLAATLIRAIYVKDKLYTLTLSIGLFGQSLLITVA